MKKSVLIVVDFPLPDFIDSDILPVNNDSRAVVEYAEFVKELCEEGGTQ